jgi:copper(I)-binding protein
MSIAIRCAVLALATLFVAPAALAQNYTQGTLKISHPWARATAQMARSGGAFLTIENTGNTPDKLLKAASPMAAHTQVHTVTMEGDVMRMREVPAIELAPKSTTELKPGGYHIMLMELSGPLKAGDKFPLTLVFEKAGTITVDVMVEKASMPMPGHDKMKH